MTVDEWCSTGAHMDCHGTVQGAAARLHPGYTYLEPVYEPFDILTADPDRLHWHSEYPRRVSKPSPPDLKVIELADYVVRFVASDGACMSLVQLWMQPNDYTPAREPLLVCEIHVLDRLRDVGCAEVERRAFALPMRRKQFST